jgi:hypothetical protein
MSARWRLTREDPHGAAVSRRQFKRRGDGEQSRLKGALHLTVAGHDPQRDWAEPVKNSKLDEVVVRAGARAHADQDLRKGRSGLECTASRALTVRRVPERDTGVPANGLL